MAEIKPNSDAFKNRKDTEKAEEKKTTGKVQIKEKSFKQKCKEAIIADDVGDLKEYAIIKVLIPAAKKTIRNLLVNMFDIRFFGKSMGIDRSDDRGSRIVSYQTKPYDIYDDDYDRPRRREGHRTLRKKRSRCPTWRRKAHPRDTALLSQFLTRVFS